MNYRHDFHAGNFADLLKHAVWLELLGALATGPEPLLVLETHAGAGLYDLAGEAARRSGEAAAGVARLLSARDAPEALRRLAETVRRVRRRLGGDVYPGSPLLAAEAMRPGDRYVGWELRPDDAARLGDALRGAARPRGPGLEARRGDGYLEAPRAVRPTAQMRRLVMIDPPFERPDEGARLTACAATLLAQGAAVVIWAPLKDLDGFDRLLSGLEALAPRRGLAVELRLRPLRDPMRLNGCALVFLDAPDVATAALDAADWLAARVGEPGGEARLHRLGPPG